MFPLKVNITAETIATACNRQAKPDYVIFRDCLIAGAMSEASGRTMLVGTCSWEYKEQGAVVEGVLPEVAVKAIKEFDGRRPLDAPLSFEVVPTTIRVPVTEELIAQAEANLANPDFDAVRDCLAAVALKKALPDENVMCGVDSMFINCVPYRVSESNADAIWTYMDRLPVEPFDLVLTIVPRS